MRAQERIYIKPSRIETEEQMSKYTALAKLINQQRLNAMTLALRQATTMPGRTRDADPKLIELTEQSFDSVTDAYIRLKRLEAALRERGDRRAIFLTIYTRMTREVQRGLSNEVFSDVSWMRAYTISFANYYRRAFLAFEHGDFGAVPAPWRIAFRTAITGENLVVQDAFLGINAHINYDLALTLLDVGLDPNRSGKYRDHTIINSVLARLVDIQQDALADLYAPGITRVDEVLGRLDEQFSHLTLREGREQAWRVATVTTDFDWPVVKTYAQWVLRATATGGALIIRSPSLDPTVHQALQRVERRHNNGDIVRLLESRLDARISD